MATFSPNTEKLLYRNNGFEVASGNEQRKDKSSGASVDVLVIGIRWIDGKALDTYDFPYKNSKGENIWFRLPDTLAPIVLSWIFNKSQGIVDCQALTDAFVTIVQQRQAGGAKWRE